MAKYAYQGSASQTSLWILPWELTSSAMSCLREANGLGRVKCRRTSLRAVRPVSTSHCSIAGGSGYLSQSTLVGTLTKQHQRRQTYSIALLNRVSINALITFLPASL
jgi:hypothetical protein